ncbi:glycoside hydrolase family 16 protein [Armillaria borealis]|uniref:Glycoside hydrolase family 16 protein n=1 Tax=Armillaria borealis TaxID=47425 RepID=A0AA39JE67_9AGAR|nr:glycoside hydrolase family 16 protein [Armillaria borealis]
MRLSLQFTLLALASSVFASHGFKRHPKRSSRLQARSETGIAYYGFQNSTMTACGVYSNDTDYIVGLGTDYVTWESKDNCFKTVTVSLRDDPSKSVDVTVTDACKDCGDSANVYLSVAAFEALSELTPGVLNVTWSFADDSASTTSQVVAITSSEAATTIETTSEAAPTTEATTTFATTTEDQNTYVATTTSTSSSSAAASTSASSSSGGNVGTSYTTSSDGWTLKTPLKGQDLIDYFHYDVEAADNDGVANYVDGGSSGLVYLDGDENVIIAIDTAETVALRNSVRMVSSTTFNPGYLFLFDIKEIPAACGTWPAVWFTGSNWPEDGEIDVVEGVNYYTKNIVSIHSGDGCTMSSSTLSSLVQASLVVQGDSNCNADVSTTGCGLSLDSTSSFGLPFNQADGGVYALQFTESGISMYFWNTGSVPDDILLTLATPTSHFKDLMMVINTNLGGTFAGADIWSTENAGGQGSSCAEITGNSDAANYILNTGSAYTDVHFSFRGIYIYTQ